MERDSHSSSQIVHAIAPAVYTANSVGAIVDTLGFEALLWVIHVGVAITGGGFTCLFQEDDVVGFGGVTTVPADGVIGGSPVIIATDANKVFRVGIIAKKRFQRLTLVETDTVTAGVIGATAVLTEAKARPVDDQNT